MYEQDTQGRVRFAGVLHDGSHAGCWVCSEMCSELVSAKLDERPAAIGGSALLAWAEEEGQVLDPETLGGMEGWTAFYGDPLLSDEEAGR